MVWKMYENVEVAVVEESGHYLAEENPEDFVRKVLAFVERAWLSFARIWKQKSRSGHGHDREFEWIGRSLAVLFLLTTQRLQSLKLVYRNLQAPSPEISEMGGQRFLNNGVVVYFLGTCTLELLDFHSIIELGTPSIDSDPLPTSKILPSHQIPMTLSRVGPLQVSASRSHLSSSVCDCSRSTAASANEHVNHGFVTLREDLRPRCYGPCPGVGSLRTGAKM
jgi:hypothetical protein